MTNPIQIDRRGNVFEIVMISTGELLASCDVGDDEMVERIADILSSKKQSEAAMQLRKMAQDARRRPQWDAKLTGR